MPTRSHVDPLAAALCIVALAVLIAAPVVVLAGSSGVDKGGAGKGFVTGCVLDFSGDAGPITMTAGSYRNQANTITVNVASSVSLASAFQAFSWATGGGIDTGAESAAWFAVHAVEHTDGTDAILLSLSASAPTAQTGQASRRLLGWVRNDGSSNLLQSYQTGDGTTRTTVYRGELIPLTAPFNVLSNGSSATLAYVDCAGVVPPTQTETALLAHQRETGTGNQELYHGTDVNGGFAGRQIGYDNGNGPGRGNSWLIRLDGDEDFAYTASAAGAYIDVIGFVSVFDGSE